MEHRWGERFAVDVAVRVAVRPYAVRSGRLIDLSMSGGAIRIALDLRLLSRIQVAIASPTHRAHQATPLISAYVTRVDVDGVGVEWCDYAPQPVVELLRRASHGRREHRGRVPAPAFIDLANSPSPNVAAPDLPAPVSLRRGTRGFSG